MKRALITGVTGQDGAYLSQFLVRKGYEVYGSYRTNSSTGLSRLQALAVDRSVRLVQLDLLDCRNVRRVIEELQPSEVYNLAGQSSVAASYEQPLRTADINGMGALRVLEALRTVKPDTRFFQASSGDMFGRGPAAPQNESTSFHPRNPYAVAKAFAHWMTVSFRQAHGLFACCGILFNHESPLRGLDFVSRKISDGVARIKLERSQRLTLGNLDAQRDWGYAADYVEAMWLALQQSEPDDYVIATGETHTVRDFVEAAFHAAGITVAWEGNALATRAIDIASGRAVVEVSSALFRPADSQRLVGNASKAQARLGWHPRLRFADLVAIMVEADLQRVATEAAA